MHLIRAIGLVLACGAGLVGCDFTEPSDRSRQAVAQPEQTPEKVAADLERTRVSVAKYAEARLKLCSDEWAKADASATALAKDAELLSSVTTCIGAERDAKGHELSHEVLLLRLLKNQEVNGLARKYLKEDFSIAAAEFAVRIREARAAAVRFEAAVGQSEATYAESVAEARKWAKASNEQREAEISRLAAEIESLEAQREKVRKELRSTTRRSLTGSAQTEQDRAERRDVEAERFGDIDREIAKRRKQIDLLREPNAGQRGASRAVQDAQMAQTRANSIKKESLSEIDRRLKPKVSVVDVTADFESRTVGALWAKIKAEAAAAEARRRRLDDQRLELMKAGAAVPASDSSELRTLKRKIDSL